MALGALGLALGVLDLLVLGVVAGEGHDAQPGEVALQVGAQVREHRLVRPVRPAVVVDHELVVLRLGRGRGPGRPALDGVVRVGGLPGLGGAAGRGRLEPPHEELPRARDVHRPVAVHRVLAEQVDAELLARLGEAHQAVERDDVREGARALVEVRHLQELEAGLLRAGFDGAPFGPLVEVVDPVVLVVQRLAQDPTPDPASPE